METIEFDPSNPVELANAFATFVRAASERISELERETAVLAHVIHLQAGTLDLLSVRNGPVDGFRREVLQGVVAMIQANLAERGQPPVKLLERLIDEPPAPGCKLTVVGGTDTEPAGNPG